jgi:chemotaxis signal transduction protein
MKTALTNLNISAPDLSDKNAFQKNMKVVMFAIGSIHCAINIFSIYKIVSSTKLYGEDNHWVSMMRVDDREVTVIDLHRRLFPNDPSVSNSRPSYIAILQNSQGEMYGLPVRGMPSLIEIGVDNIRVLPASFRQANALGMASHVAVVPQPSGQLTVFLLDVDRLLDDL